MNRIDRIDMFEDLIEIKRLFHKNFTLSNDKALEFAIIYQRNELIQKAVGSDKVSGLLEKITDTLIDTTK
jgi:hypothetical protein